MIKLQQSNCHNMGPLGPLKDWDCMVGNQALIKDNDKSNFCVLKSMLTIEVYFLD